MENKIYTYKKLSHFKDLINLKNNQNENITYTNKQFEEDLKKWNLKKLNHWVLFGNKSQATKPEIYWSKCEYVENCICDDDKYMLYNGIIYKKDADYGYNYPVYLSSQVNDEHKLMMIIKNATNLEDAEIFRLTQNKL